MATIEKISAHNYRITKMYKGKRYHMSLTRKPSKAEAERLIWQLIEAAPEVGHYQSFETAANVYMDSKSNILSPSSLRGYKSMLRNIPDDFKHKPISMIGQLDVQNLINDYAGTHSAKSTRNLNGFIGSVIRSVAPSSNFRITLPQKDHRDFYVPEDSDIDAILDYCVGTKYEIALWLATYGLRRGEICAFTSSDIDKDNIITVNKSLVEDDNGNWHVKVTKTTDSTRQLQVSDYVADLIRTCDGKVFDGYPNSIIRYLNRAQDALGIDRFSLHTMRHYFASSAREILPDGYVEKLGGWKPGSKIMKSVYDYQKEKQTKEAYRKLNEKLSKLGRKTV
jgi:integrase